MFENIVADLLTKYLGAYVENLDRDKLNISVWKGDLKLKNLKLKRGALDSFNLPISVVHGYLGSLVLKIPWTNLKGKPVIAEVDDLFIVAKPKKACKWDAKEEEERAQAVKQQKLAAYELSKMQEGGGEEEASQGGFFSAVTQTVINNIQVKVRNVHIRYEDDTTDPQHPFALGVTLEEVSARSCNSRWEVAFLSADAEMVYKLALLKSFAVYMNHEEPENILSNQNFSNIADLKEIMTDMIYDSTMLNYVVDPISGQLKLKMQPTGSNLNLKYPKFDANIEFNQWNVNLDDQQYRDLLGIVSYISNFEQFEKFRKYRPKQRPSKDPKGWWKYATSAVLDSVQQRRQKFSIEGLVARRKKKLRYIELYKRKQKVPWMQPLKEGSKDEAELNLLEKDASLEDLLFFRQLANLEIKEEGKRHAEWEAYKQKKEEKLRKKQGWFGGWWGGTPQEEEPDDDLDKPTSNVQLSQEQRDQLYEIVGYEDAKQAASKYPSDYVHTKVFFSLQRGTTTLTDFKSGKDIIQSSIFNLLVTAEMSDSNINGILTLGSFDVLDKLNKKSCFPRIVSRQSSSDTDLVRVSFEKNPKLGNADVALDLKVEPVDVHVNLDLLKKVSGFFVVPNNVNLAALERAARQQFKTLTERAQEQLEMALQNRQTLDLRVNIAAPSVYMPLDCYSKTTEFILVELGRFMVKSKVDKQGRQKRVESQKAQEQDFYDQFDLEINDTAVLTGQASEKGLRNDTVQTLVDKTTMKMKLMNCITPSNEGLAKIKAAASIPQIKAHMTPKKFEVLMKMLDQITTFTQNPTGDVSEEVGILKERALVKGPVVRRPDTNGNTKDLKWNESYLHFVGTRLLIFDSEKDTKPRSVIELSNKALINTDPSHKEEGFEHAFCISLPQSDKNTTDFYVYLSDSELRAKWVSSIGIAILGNRSNLNEEGDAINIEDEEKTPKKKDDDRVISKTQVQFAAAFYLGEVAFTVGNVDTDGKDYDVAVMKLQKYSMRYIQRNYDTKVIIELKSVSLLDCVGTVLRDEPQYILNSSSASESNALSTVNVVMTKPGSPMFDKDAKMTVNTKFDLLTATVEKRPVARLIEYAFEMQDIAKRTSEAATTYTASYQSETERQKQEVQEKRERNVKKHEKERKEKEKDLRPDMKVRANFKGISVVLQQESGKLASFTLSELIANMINEEKGMTVDGSLGNLILKDHSTPDTHYPEIMGIKASGDKSLIKFVYRQENTGNLPEPTFTKFLDAHVESIQFVYIAKFITQLQSYATEGAIMDALHAGSERATEYAKTAVEAASQSIELMKLNVNVISPHVIVPVNPTSTDNLSAKLGDISIENTLDSTDSEEKAWLEQYDIKIQDLNMSSSKQGLSPQILEEVNMTIMFSRAVLNKNHEIPNMDLVVGISDMKLRLTKEQYALAFDVLNHNIQNTGAKASTSTGTTDGGSDKSEDDDVTTKTEPLPEKDYVLTKARIDFKDLDLRIFRGNGLNAEGKPDPIIDLNIQGMGVNYMDGAQKTMEANVRIGAIIMKDTRADSNNYFKEIIKSEKDGSSHGNYCIELLYEKKANEDQIIHLDMSDPYIYFIPEVVLEAQDFFVSELDKLSSEPKKDTKSKKQSKEKAKSGKAAKDEKKTGPVITGDLRITSSISLGEDLYLSPKRRLFINGAKGSDIVIDGQQNTIHFLTGNDDAKTPLIILSPHTRLIFTNVTCRFVDRLEDFIDIGEGSTIMALSREGVKREAVEGAEMRMKRMRERAAKSGGAASQLANISTGESQREGRMLVRAELGHPRLMLPQDSSDPRSRTLVMEFGASAAYTKQGNTEKAIAEVKQIRVFAMLDNKQGVHILEPVTITVGMEGSESEESVSREIKMEVNAIDARLSYQDLKLVTDVAASVSKKDEAENDKSEKKEETDEAVSETLTETTDISELDMSDDEFEDAMEDELEAPEDAQKEPQEVVENDKTKSSAEEQSKAQAIKINFAAKRLGILVVDDFRGYDIPLLDFRIFDMSTAARMQSEAESSKINAGLKFQMLANYYNLSLASWEPVMESWNCAVNYAQKPTFHPKYPTAQEVKVDSSSPLNINVTHSMVDTVLKTSKLWTEGLKEKTKQETVSSKKGMYVLRNQTGKKIEFWKEPKKGETAEPQEILPGSTIDFDWPIRRLKDPDEYIAQFNAPRNIFIRIPGLSQEPYKIPVNRVKTIPFLAGSKSVMKADIQLREGSKVITLRSPVKIINNTTIPMSFRYALSDNNSQEIGTAEAGQEIGVPFEALESGIVVMKPVEEEETHEWSKARKLHKFSELTKATGKVIIQCQPKSGSNADTIFFVMDIDVDIPISASLNFDQMTPQQKMMSLDYALTIKPPLSVENLLGCPMNYKLIDKPSDKTAPKQIATGTLKRGEYRVFYNANVYNDIWLEASPPGEWRQESVERKRNNDEKRMAKVHSVNGTDLDKGICLYDKDKNPLILELDYEPTQSIESQSTVSVYAPYWIIDKTGMDMQVRNASANSRPLAAGWDYGIAEENDLHLFSFHKHNPFENKVTIKVGDSEFSKPFSMDNVGATLPVVADGKKRRYHIGASFSLAPGKFSKTKVVTFSPQYVVVNHTGHLLELQQTECTETVSLKNNERTDWFWFNKADNPRLRMKFGDEDYFWSLPFGLTSLGDLYIKMMHKEGPQFGSYSAKVSIVQEDATIYAVFEPQPKRPPVKIENRLWRGITFSQVESDQWWDVAQRSKLDYTWDNINNKQVLNVLIGDNQVKVNMDKVGKEKFVPLNQQLSMLGSFRNTIQKKADSVMLKVEAHGSTKVLRIAAVSEEKENEEERKKEIDTFKFEANLAGLGLSIIDDSPKEMAYILFSELKLLYSTSNIHETIFVKLGTLQIDNQLRSGLFPVMFSPAKKLDTNTEPFLQATIVKSLEDTSIDYYEVFNIHMLEANLSVDYAFVVTAINEYNQLSKYLEDKDEVTVEAMLDNTKEPELDFSSSRNMFFKMFMLQPIKVNLTFINNLEGALPNSPVFVLLKSLGVAFINIDNAPLRLNALILEHPFLTKDALTDRITKHYTKEGVKEVYKILGSFDAIGNPVGLFNDVSTGVYDFFYEPARGIRQSPGDFAVGIRNGTMSLLKNSLHGTFNTATKITGTVSKGVGMLSMDKDYVQARQRAASNRPRHVGEELVDGSLALGKGIFQGATGIVTKPIEGAMRGGATGFITGVGKGIIGVPVKPVAGVLDLATKTTEGLKNTTTYFDRVPYNRIRPPRVFGDDGLLLQYSHSQALGQEIVINVSGGAFAAEKTVYLCPITGSDRYVIATIARILYVRVPSPSRPEEEWNVPYSEVSNIRADANGLVIDLRNPVKRGLFKKTQERRIESFRMQVDHVRALSRRLAKLTEQMMLGGQEVQ